MKTALFILLLGCGALAVPHRHHSSRESQEQTDAKENDVVEMDISVLGGVKELKVGTSRGRSSQSSGSRSWPSVRGVISQQPESVQEVAEVSQQQQQQLDDIERQLEDNQDRTPVQSQKIEVQQQIQQTRRLKQEQDEIKQQIEQESQSAQSTSPNKLNQIQRQQQQLQQKIDLLQQTVDQESPSSNLLGARKSTSVQQLLIQSKLQQIQIAQIKQQLEEAQQNAAGPGQMAQVKQQKQEAQQLQQQLNQVTQEIQREAQNNQPTSPAKLNQIQTQQEQLQQEIDSLQQAVEQEQGTSLSLSTGGRTQPGNLLQLKAQIQLQQLQLDQIKRQQQGAIGTGQEIQVQQKIQNVQQQINQIAQEIRKQAQTPQSASPSKLNLIERQQDSIQQQLGSLQQLVSRQQQSQWSPLGIFNTRSQAWSSAATAGFGGVSLQRLASQAQRQQNQIQQIDAAVQDVQANAVSTSRKIQAQRQMQQVEQLQRQLNDMEEEIQDEANSPQPTSLSKVNQIQRKQDELQVNIDQLQQSIGPVGLFGAGGINQKRQSQSIWGTSGPQSIRQLLSQAQQQQGQIQRIEGQLQSAQRGATGQGQQIQIQQLLQQALQVQQQARQVKQQIEASAQSPVPPSAVRLSQNQRQQNQLQQNIDQLEQTAEQVLRQQSGSSSMWMVPASLQSQIATIQNSPLRQNPWLARRIGQTQWLSQTPRHVQLLGQLQQQKEQVNQIQNDLQDIQQEVTSQLQQLQVQQQLQAANAIQQELDDVAQRIQETTQSGLTPSIAVVSSIQAEQSQLQQKINRLQQQVREQQQQLGLQSVSRLGGWTRTPRGVVTSSRRQQWSSQSATGRIQGQGISQWAPSVQQLVSQAEDQQVQLNEIQNDLLNSQREAAGQIQQIQVQKQKQQLRQLQHQQNSIEQQLQQEVENDQPTPVQVLNQIQRQQVQQQQQLDRLKKAVQRQRGQRGQPWQGSVGLGATQTQGQTVRQRQEQAGQLPNQWDEDQTEQGTLDDLVQKEVTPAQNQDLQQQRQVGQLEAQAVQISPVAKEIQINDPQTIKKQGDVLRLVKNINQQPLDDELVQAGNSYSIEANSDKYTDQQAVRNLGKQIEKGILPRGEIFSVFNPDHLKQVIAVFKVLYHAQDWDTFINTAAWARVNVNEGVFLHALSVALAQRGDTDLITLPPTYEITPNYFVNSHVIQKAQNVKQLISDTSRPREYVIIANYSGSHLNLDPEQALSYFLEDVGLNDFYFDYNINYPFWLNTEYLQQGGDRRGEQSYFLAQQLLARYYMERLSNNVGDIPEINLEDKMIETGYVPSLRYPNGLEFPARPSKVFLGRDEEVEDIQDMARRIKDAIDSGKVSDEDGNDIDISGEDGFDTLMNIIQSTPESLNPQFYGALEVVMRWVLGNSLEPLDQNKLAPSALEHFETTLRDPAAWQLLKKVVKLAQQYKQKLPSYNEQQVHFPGVEVQSVQVSPLVTFFDKNDIDITNAVYVNEQDVATDSIKILARQARLNNQPFTVKINVNSQQAQPAVVRILLGPKHDEYGREININDNRLNFIELDKFPVQLRPGSNNIIRESKEMNVVDDSASAEELEQQVEQALSQQTPLQLSYDDILTGFPKRLLLPKGQRGGQVFQIMVVVSPLVESPAQQQAQQQMQQAVLGQDPTVQRGILNQNVDGLPLGFPLDREVDEVVLANAPNLALQDVLIVHEGPEIAEAQKEIQNESQTQLL